MRRREFLALLGGAAAGLSWHAAYCGRRTGQDGCGQAAAARHSARQGAFSGATAQMMLA